VRWASCSRYSPRGLRRRVSAFQAYALPMPSGGPQVNPETLTMIAGRVPGTMSGSGFEYRAHSGTATRRSRGAIPPWSTTGGAGTWWPGTPTGTTGAPSGSTGWSRGRRPAPRFRAPVRCRPDREILARVARGTGRSDPGGTGHGWVVPRARRVHTRPAADPRFEGGTPWAKKQCAFEAWLPTTPEMLAPLPGDARRGFSRSSTRRNWWTRCARWPAATSGAIDTSPAGTWLAP